MLCILDATSPAEATRAERVAAAWPGAKFAVGVHPHRAGEFIACLDEVGPRLRSGRPAARADTPRGREIGLDYHYDFAPRESSARCSGVRSGWRAISGDRW